MAEREEESNADWVIDPITGQPRLRYTRATQRGYDATAPSVSATTQNQINNQLALQEGLKRITSRVDPGTRNNRVTSRIEPRNSNPALRSLTRVTSPTGARPKPTRANPGSVNGIPMSSYNELVDRGPTGIPARTMVPGAVPQGNAPSLIDQLTAIQDAANQPAAVYSDPNALARVRAMAVSDKGLYDAAIARVNENYDRAQRDTLEPVSGVTGQLSAGLQNLGIPAGDVAASRGFNEYDANARNLRETFDLNRTTDTSTLEKLGAMSGEAFAGLARAYENGYNPYAPDPGSGGSSGSSTSDLMTSLVLQQMMDNQQTDTATEDMVFNNPDVAAAIARIKDPKLRALADTAYLQSKGNVDTALSNAAARRIALTNLRLPRKPNSKWDLGIGGALNLIQRIKEAQARGPRAAEQEALIDFFRQFSTNYAPQVTNRTVTAKGQTQNKNTTTGKITRR